MNFDGHNSNYIIFSIALLIEEIFSKEITRYPVLHVDGEK